MSVALFISEKYLKDNSIISENVDFKQLKPEIIAIQDIYIEPLLGTGLYREIKAQIVAGTVSSANQTLLDTMISPCLMWYIMAFSPIALSYKYANKGVLTKQGGDSSNPATLDELNNVTSEYKNRAEAYAERLIKFLLENHNTYPLYNNPGTGIDVIIPKRAGYSVPMSLAMPYTMDKKDKIQYNNWFID